MSPYTVAVRTEPRDTKTWTSEQHSYGTSFLRYVRSHETKNHGLLNVILTVRTEPRDTKTWTSERHSSYFLWPITYFRTFRGPVLWHGPFFLRDVKRHGPFLSDDALIAAIGTMKELQNKVLETNMGFG
jgi:hypothetical protein